MPISVPPGAAQSSNPPPVSILGQAGVAGVGGLVWVGAWSSLVTYTYGMAVTYQGSSYVAIGNSLNSAPTPVNPAWQVLATAGTGVVQSVVETNGLGLDVLGALSMLPASAANAGVVTTGTQTLGGAKTFAVNPLLGTGAVSGAASSLGAVCAIYNRDASQTLARNTDAIPDASTMVVDTHSAVTTGASWAFVVPAGQGGVYQVSAALGFIPNVTTSRVQLHIFLNGSKTRALATQLSTNAQATHVVSGSSALKLVPGDSINVRANIADTTTDITTRAGVENMNIAIFRVPGS